MFNLPLPSPLPLLPLSPLLPSPPPSPPLLPSSSPHPLLVASSLTPQHFPSRQTPRNNQKERERPDSSAEKTFLDMNPLAMPFRLHHQGLACAWRVLISPRGPCVRQLLGPPQRAALGYGTFSLTPGAEPFCLYIDSFLQGGHVLLLDPSAGLVDVFEAGDASAQNQPRRPRRERGRGKDTSSTKTRAHADTHTHTHTHQTKRRPQQTRPDVYKI